MLSVWLPLNGDLHNQGLSNITAINNGATVDNNGKIGKCYSFDGNDDFINLGNIGSYFDGSAFSICFWIFSLENKTRAAVFSSYGLSSTSNFFGLELNSSSNNYCNNNLRFDWLGSDTYSPDDFVTYNAWTHICVTYDGVNQIRMYKNGALIQTSTRVLNAIPVGNTYYLGRDSRTGSTAFNGKLNDFRIYDHCLSPRECKQVSAALVLHYPLNRGGFGGENLLKNSHNKYDNNGYYVGTYTFVDSSKLETGKTYTLSFNGELQDDTQTGWYFNIFPSPYTAIINKPTDKEGRFAFSFVMPENGGNRTSIGCYSLPLGNRLGCAIWDVKLEEGSTATPWTPAPSDDLYSQMGLDNNIEYDVSGYTHNAVRNNITYSSDSPRYNVSYVLNGTNTCYIESASLPSETQSVSFWIKTGTVTSSSVVFADYGSKIAFGFSGNNTTYIVCDLPSSSSNYSTGTRCVAGDNWKSDDWNHIVVIRLTSSPSYTFKTYLNGVLLENSSTNFWTHTTDNFTIGRRSVGSPFNGQISDLRAYVTQLSEDNILELYHTPISLSSNGTLLTQGEFVEG